MDNNEIDYGSWLTEDLRDLYKQALKDRDRSWMIYSDRAQLNQMALKILAELQKRNDCE